MNTTQELNAEQSAVIASADGPCLVLAGAGSGKTRTITHRVAHLLEHGTPPDQILLVTFTNKAAREMISRVDELTNGRVRLPWAGTFHHIAYRILKQYAPLVSYKQNFTILDSEDSRDLVKLAVKEAGFDSKSKRFPSPAVIQSILSYARNAQAALDTVVEEKHPSWVFLAKDLARIADAYIAKKRAANAMDFDDLLVNLNLLLEQSPRVRDRFASQFKYILVDEYQDTNRVQASIIRNFASVHNNVLVVGDDAQSIYSFRAANIENILRFEHEYPGANIFRLETNYRSTPEILALANDVITQNRSQHEKVLRAVKDTQSRPELYALADASEEATTIATRIQELEDEGVPLKDIGVLFRATHHSQALEMELTRRQIPYEYRGGMRFFERAHIKDVLAFLRAFHNASDTLAWTRILLMQVGIGPAVAQKILSVVLQTEHSKTTLTNISENLPARAQKGFSDFLSIWDAMHKTDGSPSALIHAVLQSKYGEYLEFEYPDFRERRQDIEQLALFGQRETDLNKFLAEASLQESYATPGTRDAAAAHDQDKLVLSTIHQAKGLEWEAVFIMNLSAGQFPNERALKERGGLEEERRLLYVAITRAKRYLHLSYPLMGGFSSFLQGPSMFLDEIDRELISDETITSLGSTVFTDPSDEGEGITYEAEDASWEKKKSSFLKDIDEL